MNRKAIFARIDLVAHDRGLPRSEIKKAKSNEEAMFDFGIPSCLEPRLAVPGRPSRPDAPGPRECVLAAFPQPWLHGRVNGCGD
jgi:hypothetical protein